MQKNRPIAYLIAKTAALLLLLSGGLFAFYNLFGSSGSYPAIEVATFLDTIAVPIDWAHFGTLSFPIQVDNYLVFQEFHSLPPAYTLLESYGFGIVVFAISVTALALFSTFRKLPFLLASSAWIILLTIFNPNGLNIGSLSSNIPLLIMIVGTVLPLVYFHVWNTDARFLSRWLVILFTTGGSLVGLIQLSPIVDPSLFLAEQSLVIGLGLALAWIFWQGHAVISASYLLLARANQHISMKISWQILGIAALYLVTLIFILLDLKGEVDLPFPTFSPLYLVLPIGILGWISTGAKLQQEPDIATRPAYLKALFVLGFSMSFWLIWKLEVSENRAATEFLKHLIVYSQFGFSLFFIVYLMSNFFSIMDSGKPVDKILYKPYSLPYYHLRIGGLIAILVVVIYMDAVLAPQVSSLTTNLRADYYYQTGQKLEASILYENSWAAYRKNPKAKNATAHLLFELNQPTVAKANLDESQAEAPQVDNILLLSSRMLRENKLFEAVFYLENGLARFPDNPYLINNLALLKVKLQKGVEALSLLETHQTASPVIASNLIALQNKLRTEQSQEARGTGLPTQINSLAGKNLQQEPRGAEELNALRQALRTETSPMLINAGIRNLLSIPNNSGTEQDIAWIDSITRKPEMLDYLMQMQETASIRSLAGGRVTESVKNLNGLAFRNPGDAGYYLNLTAGILARNLDFEKASKDILVAEEKGFKAFRPYHLMILDLGGLEAKSAEMRTKYGVQDAPSPDVFLTLLSRFNQTIPDMLYDQWSTLPTDEMKATWAYLLLERKSHGLTKFQLNELGNSLKGRVEKEEKLAQFLQNPDWSDQSSLLALCEFLNVGEELTANPYHTPLILSAADRLPDPLAQYELLNTASEFNKDPLLWIRKVQAAKRIGLDNYATDAIQEMSTWMSWDEIEVLQAIDY
jgi:hypothetical protein